MFNQRCSNTSIDKNVDIIVGKKKDFFNFFSAVVQLWKEKVIHYTAKSN